MLGEVDVEVPARAIDLEVVRHARIHRELQTGEVGVAREVVEDVRGDRARDDLRPVGRDLATPLGARLRQDAEDVLGDAELREQLPERTLRAEHARVAVGGIVPLEEPVLVLDVVPEGDVSHVVQQGRDANHARLLRTDLHRARRVELEGAIDRVDHPLRDVHGPDRVIEARVHRAGVDQVGRAELLHAAQALHLGGVQDAQFLVRQVHVSVYRFAHHAVLALARQGGLHRAASGSASRIL